VVYAICPNKECGASIRNESGVVYLLLKATQTYEIHIVACKYCKTAIGTVAVQRT
jgi:hypothetical protein